MDFKWTTGRPHRNHIFQLCGYALLLEDHFQQPVTKGFVYLIPVSDAVVFDLTPDLKDQTRTMLSEIRRMIEKEEMPPTTPATGCSRRWPRLLVATNWDGKIVAAT